jgi:DNA-binding Lrp family transcriptional regulator
MTENVIISFVPVINYNAIGYAVHALLVSISPLDKERERKLRNFAANNLNVLWAVKAIGRFNFLAYVCTRNELELQETIKQLRSLFPLEIKRYDSLLAFEQYKYTYVPDCVFKDQKA